MKIDYAYKTMTEGAPDYNIRLVIPADSIQERIDREGADDVAMLIGRLVLRALTRLEGEIGRT